MCVASFFVVLLEFVDSILKLPVCDGTTDSQLSRGYQVDHRFVAWRMHMPCTSCVLCVCVCADVCCIAGSGMDAWVVNVCLLVDSCGAWNAEDQYVQHRVAAAGNAVFAAVICRENHLLDDAHGCTACGASILFADGVAGMWVRCMLFRMLSSSHHLRSTTPPTTNRTNVVVDCVDCAGSFRRFLVGRPSPPHFHLFLWLSLRVTLTL